jgi:AraC family transcriptional regulator, regulatory protein of adaptative response / methylated-DNA-[protein]-cysteine methyltransferase
MIADLMTPAPHDDTQAALDYQRVERAIAFLAGRYREQPDLAAAARAAHLSEFHFQKVFTRWAGISPKRFVQFLTVEHAKQRLAASRAVLDAAFDAGLSGPGRLHDLFVSVEAVTPGEFKSRGAGIHIDYAVHPTRFGRCLLGVTKRGVCWLSFVEPGSEAAAVRELRTHWCGANFAACPVATAPTAAKIFRGLDARPASLGVLVMGTNFQLKVWQALLRIPPGAVTTYETLGLRLGAGNAARAIANAVANNAIGYLIPCHRVIRKSGLVTGYRWGSARKQAILGWEALHANA